MDLREFVKETLVAISDGISDADTVIKSSGGVVNPGSFRYGSGKPNYAPPRSTVEFDVAVSAEKSKSDGSGVKAKVFVLEAKLGEDQGSKETRLSRVKFNVDVIFPNPGDEQSDRLAEAKRK